MRYLILISLSITYFASTAQVRTDLKKFGKNGADVSVKGNVLTVSWPAGEDRTGRVTIDLGNETPLFKNISLLQNKRNYEIATDLDPAFVLTVGKRDLISQNGWNIFFDKVPEKPFKAHKIDMKKESASVETIGSRTVIKIGSLNAPGFTGTLEITLYNRSALMNIAAVMSTDIDSTAILYDAGLMSRKKLWDKIGWSDVYEKMQAHLPTANDTATALEVKYRTIVGESQQGSLAVFPAPHQYFYPLMKRLT